MSNPRCIQNPFDNNLNSEYFVNMEYLLNNFKVISIEPFFEYSQGGIPTTVNIHNPKVFYIGSIYGIANNTNSSGFNIYDDLNQIIMIKYNDKFSATEYQQNTSIENILFNYCYFSNIGIWYFVGFKIKIS